MPEREGCWLVYDNGPQSFINNIRKIKRTDWVVQTSYFQPITDIYRNGSIYTSVFSFCTNLIVAIVST